MVKFKEFVIAFVFFLILISIFFYKVFLGLVPLPGDLIVGAYYPWLEYNWGGYPLGVPVKNPKLSDAVSLFYPLKALGVEYMRKGDLPLWNPHMFGGYPLLASVQAGLLFPTIIFYLLFSTHLGWTLQTMSQPFLAGLFMYLLLRHLKLRRFPSVFGAIAYGFGGFSLMWMQWNTQATTSMFLPILIFFEDKYLITKRALWGVLLSIFLCLQFLAGYLPVIPPTLLSLGIWFLLRSDSFIKDIRIAFFFILGFALSAVFSLPVMELILNSQRGIEDLGSQSPFTAFENFFTLIAPDFFGNDATGNFWGKGDHMDATLYTGIATLTFSIIAIKQFFKKREIIFALILLVVAVVISVANPISEFLYDLGIWGGASITMNRVNFMINFALALLGAYGLSILRNHNFKISLNPILWIFSAAVGLSIGLFISRDILTKMQPQPKDSLLYDVTTTLVHINIAINNLILPIAIIIICLLLFIIVKYFKRIRGISEIAFIAILVLELFRFGWKFNAFSPPQFIYPRSTLTDYLSNFPNDRVVSETNILPANMWVLYNISSIEGYDGIYPLRMAKLLAVANSGSIDSSPQPRWGILNQFNSNILDATNSRFMLAIKIDKKGVISPEGEVNYLLQTPKFKEVFSDHSVAVLENQESLPRAYVTKQVIKSSDQQMLSSLIDENFPLKKISLADNLEFNNTDPKEIQADIKYSQLKNSHVQVKTETDQDSYLVVLDTFYPGWEAFVDGVETDIHRTNYDFRGVLLPKGMHTVDFYYKPKSLFYGSIITATSILIILIFLIKPLFYRKLVKRKY